MAKWLIPWSLVVAFGVYHVVTYVQKREAARALVEALPPDLRKTVSDVEMISKGPFRVAAFRDSLNLGAEVVEVVAYDKYMVFIEREDKPDTMRVTLYKDLTAKGEFLMCGSVDDRPFPAYLVLIPQAGPDAGRKWYRDGDLSGVWSLKSGYAMPKSASSGSATGSAATNTGTATRSRTGP